MARISGRRDPACDDSSGASRGGTCRSTIYRREGSSAAGVNEHACGRRYRRGRSKKQKTRKRGCQGGSAAVRSLLDVDMENAR